ncbi:MAG: dTDP-4-dehydrorhamnose 3,5-epimerase [Hyphomicrobiaceae bacterium]
MEFRETELADLRVIALSAVRDDRGYFARTYCSETMRRHGLDHAFPQHSVSFSKERGTLRGMHFQLPPHAETKLVRCLNGSIYDVIVDLRPESPTYRKWQGFELSAGDLTMLYVPKGFAHGFQTLTDDVEVAYMISTPYAPDAARGIRYDDPAIGIVWPLPVSVISERDRAWAHLEPA